MGYQTNLGKLMVNSPDVSLKWKFEERYKNDAITGGEPSRYNPTLCKHSITRPSPLDQFYPAPDRCRA